MSKNVASHPTPLSTFSVVPVTHPTWTPVTRRYCLCRNMQQLPLHHILLSTLQICGASFGKAFLLQSCAATTLDPISRSRSRLLLLQITLVPQVHDCVCNHAEACGPTAGLAATALSYQLRPCRSALNCAAQGAPLAASTFLMSDARLAACSLRTCSAVLLRCLSSSVVEPALMASISDTACSPDNRESNGQTQQCQT